MLSPGFEISARNALSLSLALSRFLFFSLFCLRGTALQNSMKTVQCLQSPCFSTTQSCSIWNHIQNPSLLDYYTTTMIINRIPTAWSVSSSSSFLTRSGSDLGVGGDWVVVMVGVVGGGDGGGSWWFRLATTLNLPTTHTRPHIKLLHLDGLGTK